MWYIVRLDSSRVATLVKVRSVTLVLIGDPTRVNQRSGYVIVKERHETIMGYKPRERVALEWFIPIIVELLVL